MLNSTLLVAALALPQISVQSTPPRGTKNEVLPAEVVRAQLAGEPASSFPHFRFVDTIFQGAPLRAAFDSRKFPSYVGAAADVYVVMDKRGADWIEHPALVDATGSALHVTIQAGGVVPNTFVLDNGTLAGSSGATLGLGYDVVFDFDVDGRLSRGDVIDGFGEEPGIWVIADTNSAGPYTVSSAVYSGGSFLGQIVYYPSNVATLGELPLVVVSHGNGHNYQWYGHIGNHMASWGYVVMAHENDTNPGPDTAAATTVGNTDYLLGNLGLIAGGALAGHVDSSRIVWIGHSMGGEGVVRAWKLLSLGQLTATNFGIADIRLVATMAPVTLFPPVNSNTGTAPFHLFYGASDTDVTGSPHSQDSHPFILYERANGPKSSLYLQGVGHAWFHDHGGNCFCTGPSLLDEPTTHLVELGYFLPIIEHYSKANPACRDFLERSFQDFHPPSIPANVVVASESRPAKTDYVAIDDYQTQTALNVSSSGGAVTYNVASVFEGAIADNDASFGWNASVPMNGMTRAMIGQPADDGKAVVFDWPAGTSAFYELALVPALRDLSGVAAISLRACQGTRHPNTLALDSALDLALTLRDGLGNTSTIALADYGNATSPYKRTGFGTAAAGWANEFCTFRVPVGDFAADGTTIDLTDIVAVRLELGPPAGDAPGRLAIDDVILIGD